MFESGSMKTLLILFIIVLIFTFLRCSTARKNIRSISCEQDSTLLLTVEKEFVELSFQKVYNLTFKNNNEDNTRNITGNIH